MLCFAKDFVASQATSAVPDMVLFRKHPVTALFKEPISWLQALRCWRWKIMEKALERYYRHFGKPYPLLTTSTRAEAEILDRIQYCIAANQLEAEPEYKDGIEY